MALRHSIVCVLAASLLAAPLARADSVAEMADASPLQPSANVLMEPVGDVAPVPAKKKTKAELKAEAKARAAEAAKDKAAAKAEAKAKAKAAKDTPIQDADDTRVDALQPALAAPEGAKEDGKQDLFITALANVYDTHPQLKAQRETLEATDENVSQATSALRPNVGATYAYGRVGTQRDNSGTAETKALTATQPLFVGGALSGIKGAKQRVKAGQAQLTALEQQVLFDAVVAYSNVVNRLAVLQVNQNNVDLLNKQYLATKSRFEVGEITRTDMAQAQSRLATAKANERSSLGALDVDRATFRRVIGFDAPDSLKLPPAPADMPQSLEAAQQEATANEPTLSAAQELEKASKSDVSVYKGAILPSVNVAGSLRDVDNSTVGGVQGTSNAVTLNVTVPLYQSGAEYSRVRQAKDLAQRAKYVTMDTKNAVIETVTQAWENYVTAGAVITSNEEAVRAAKTAMNSIQQENKFGTRTILDVLNTQQDMVNAQVSLVNARVAERQASYSLLQAVGRLTAKGLHLPVDINDPNQHYDKVKYKLIGF